MYYEGRKKYVEKEVVEREMKEQKGTNTSEGVVINLVKFGYRRRVEDPVDCIR
jgi:hypothetical protein